MVGIKIWNPICKRIVNAQIINSFHGIYNQYYQIVGILNMMIANLHNQYQLYY